MMSRSASEKPSPWRHISERVGSGSCVSLRTLPAMNAEANVSRKRKTFSSGGRSAPSVPGPGGGGGRSGSVLSATRKPFPRLADKIQPEARLALHLARNRPLRARLRPTAHQREHFREVLVRVVRLHSQ